MTSLDIAMLEINNIFLYHFLISIYVTGARIDNVDIALSSVSYIFKSNFEKFQKTK